MASWLGRQRKPELVALAERAGLDEYETRRDHIGTPYSQD